MCSWVSFLVLVLCFSFNVVSDARHRKHTHSAAVLVGTVYCDTCFHQQVSESKHFIQGATVAVECRDHSEKQRFREEVKTNEKGEFEAKLPASFSNNEKKIKECYVTLISSNSPYCAVAASATAQQIHFKSKKEGSRIFSAGFFTFKPELCNQKNTNEKDFPPTLPDPPTPFLPPIGEGVVPPLPIPELPIPPLVPPLPNLPRIPLPPITRQTSSESNKLTDQKIFGFPPNPLQPPSIFPTPSIFPPLPFQPSPPSLIPPLIPSPSPPSLFPPLPSFPPIPSLIPSPPPPPPPVLPFPLPPLPLIPGFPPVPPASTKTTP